MDWPLLNKFIKYTADKSQKSIAFLVFDTVRSVFFYNISILEYFQFHFAFKPDEDRKQYAGTGFMYEYQKIMNPHTCREILEDKKLFYEMFKEESGRDAVFSKDILFNKSKVIEFLRSKNPKLVLKPSKGGSGKGLEIVNRSDIKEPTHLELLMKRKKADMAEDFVYQHSSLMALSPVGLNTIRIITQIRDKKKVDFIGARLRVSINSIVDNLAAGNVAAVVSLESGIVSSKGFYSDITKEPISVHPITNVNIVGFQVPFWNETLELVKTAALKIANSNKSVGWDIGISETGPLLIEGNHDWCKLVWQLPSGVGLKADLVKYLD